MNPELSKLDWDFSDVPDTDRNLLLTLRGELRCDLRFPHYGYREEALFCYPEPSSGSRCRQNSEHVSADRKRWRL